MVRTALLDSYGCNSLGRYTIAVAYVVAQVRVRYRLHVSKELSSCWTDVWMDTYTTRKEARDLTAHRDPCRDLQDSSDAAGGQRHLASPPTVHPLMRLLDRLELQDLGGQLLFGRHEGHRLFQGTPIRELLLRGLHL